MDASEAVLKHGLVKYDEVRIGGSIHKVGIGVGSFHAGNAGCGYRAHAGRVTVGAGVNEVSAVTVAIEFFVSNFGGIVGELHGTVRKQLIPGGVIVAIAVEDHVSVAVVIWSEVGVLHKFDATVSAVPKRFSVVAGTVVIPLVFYTGSPGCKDKHHAIAEGVFESAIALRSFLMRGRNPSVGIQVSSRRVKCKTVASFVAISCPSMLSFLAPPIFLRSMEMPSTFVVVRVGISARSNWNEEISNGLGLLLDGDKVGMTRKRREIRV